MRAQPIVAGLVVLLTSFALITVGVWHVDGQSIVVSRAVSLVFFLLTVPFLVLAHEFGHYAVARLLGWRVPLFSWGPFTLRCSPLRLTVGAPAFGSGAAGAVVAVSPPGSDSNWAWALVSAGGPLMNVLLAGAAFAVADRAPSDSTAESLFIVFAVISLCSGLFNLWPRGGSDGAHILNVLCYRNGVLRGQRARLLEQTITGVRPRDWPQPLIGTVLRESVWSVDPEIQLATYAWHMDRGDIVSARAALSRAVPDERVLAEQAFIAASVERDAGAARNLLARTHSWAIHGQTCYWRAEAAIAAAEGDGARLLEAVRKGRILCREWPYATAFDCECFDVMERKVVR